MLRGRQTNTFQGVIAGSWEILTNVHFQKNLRLNNQQTFNYIF